MPKTKIFSDAALNQLIQEASSLPTAMDTSSGYHGPEGYPKTDIPAKFLNLLAVTLGKDALLKSQKSETAWIFSVRADKFEVKYKDLKDYFSFGLIGIRFDTPNTILLYFKH